ncbi:MAG: hypothetical protein R3C14_15245 [Caldilineaceae bacterium]
MNAFVQQKTEQQHRKSVPLFYPPPAESFDTPWQITVYSATHERERWQRYNEIANRSYATRGLQAVGEERSVDIDQYPTYFAEATIDGAAPIGGVRLHLPNCCGEIPLLEELIGYIDIEILSSLLAPLQSEGITQGSSLWIDPARRYPGLAGDLARACCAIFVATEARWYVGCAHQYVLDAWHSVGWRAVPSLPTFPYPDSRYRSFIQLGSQDIWPNEFRLWAEKQVENTRLDGPGARLIVQPMRQK